MLQLPQSLAAWNTPQFESVLKNELEQVDGKLLPLQQGLARSSYALTDNFSISIITVSDEPDCIRVKAGIFYQGIIPGCSCADDPTPIDEMTEYCVVQLDIDRRTAETAITLLDD